MVYVVDLDDTLVLTKNLNNDAYNFALEQNGHRRIKTKKRLTRENFGETASKKLITDKQNYFAQKWLKNAKNFRFSIIEVFLNKDDTSPYILERERYWKEVFRSKISVIMIIDFIDRKV